MPNQSLPRKQKTDRATPKESSAAEYDAHAEEYSAYADGAGSIEVESGHGSGSTDARVDMQPHPVPLRSSYVLTGTVNGQPISLTGAGWVDESQGETQGWWHLHQAPDGFSIEILGAFLITGHASATRSLPNLSNPFFGTSQHYERKLTFPGHPGYGQILFSADCVRRDETICSSFEMSGTLNLPRLKQIQDLVEVWTPERQGRVRGVFAPVWEPFDGYLIQGVAETVYDAEYSDGTKMHCDQVMHRLVSMATTHEQERDGTLRFAKHQHSSLIDPRAIHASPSKLEATSPTDVGWAPFSIQDGHRLRRVVARAA